LSITPRLKFTYDVNTDVLEVEGVKFSGHFFRQIAERDQHHTTIPVGAPIMIVERKDGAVIFKRLSKEDLWGYFQ
jgi:hypothetical protein